MLADLDLLLTEVFCTADDLLLEKGKKAKRLSHLFPKLPKQPGYCKSRQRCAGVIEWLISVFAAVSH